MTETRWAVIGTGAAASTFAQAVESLPDARLCAVASRRAERAQSFASKFNAARSHDSYQELVDQGGIDAVYVASQPTKHVEHALSAIHAGIPVLIEKPFASTQAEAVEIIDAARAAQVFCMEAMWSRFNPTVRKVTKLIRDGAIGDIVHIDASLGYHFAEQTGHRFEPIGGGALLDLGVYPFSLIATFVAERAQVQSVAVFADNGVDLHNVSAVTYASGVSASVTSSLRCRCRNDMVITGTDATIIMHAPLLKPTVHRVVANPPDTPSPGGRHILSRIGGRAAREVSGRPRYAPIDGSGYEYQITEVADCLAAGLLESAVMPWADTLAVMATLDAVRSSWATS